MEEGSLVFSKGSNFDDIETCSIDTRHSNKISLYIGRGRSTYNLNKHEVMELVDKLNLWLAEQE